MASGVNVKMGVTGVSDFKRGMKDAESAVKALDSALKLNEAQLKLNGNEELVLKNKVELLKEQIKAQSEVVKQAQFALNAMRSNGVKETSKAFQEMQQKVYDASTKLVDMKTNLNDVEKGASGAKKETGWLNDKLKNIGNGVSWQNVTDGLKNITDQLKDGAKAAINFGKRIAQSATSSTAWADEIHTMATQYGIDDETMQKMQNVAEFVDTSVDTIIRARQTLMKKVGSGDRRTGSIMSLLGVEYNGDAEQTFWDIGKAIMAIGDEAERESYATTLFGKSWHELIPLFATGREEYDKFMAKQEVLTNEQIKSLTEADDAIKQVQQQIELLKNQFWSENASKIVELLEWLTKNRSAVVGAIESIGIAFGALKLGQFALNLEKTIKGFKELGILGGKTGGNTPTATSDATGTPTGTVVGGTNALSTMLNYLTLFGAAGSMYQATEGQIRENLKNWDAQMEGMTETQKQRYALQQTFPGISEEDLNQLMMPERQDGHGRYFGVPDPVESTFSLEKIAQDAAAALDRATQVAEELQGKTGTNGNQITSEDLNGFRTVPALMTAALQKGVSGIKVTLDGHAVGVLVAPYVSQEIAKDIP